MAGRHGARLDARERADRGVGAYEADQGLVQSDGLAERRVRERAPAGASRGREDDGGDAELGGDRVSKAPLSMRRSKRKKICRTRGKRCRSVRLGRVRLGRVRLGRVRLARGWEVKKVGCVRLGHVQLNGPAALPPTPAYR